MTKETHHLRMYLMRHGEIDAAHRQFAYGSRDINLSTIGEEQSHWMCQQLSGVKLDAVYSSDLKRASFASNLIARHHHLAVIHLPQLREVHMGEWENQPIADIYEKYPKHVKHLFQEPESFQYPQGEHFLAFKDRVLSTLKVIIATHQTGSVAVVAHGGVTRLVIAHVLEIPPRHMLRIGQDFGCLNVIDWYQDGPILRLLNQVKPGE